MAFLRNTWYIAAWSAELQNGETKHRRLLGESVLLYRSDTGKAVALSNTCPHRFAPLSMGRVFGETVECKYHGLRFDVTGKCVLNPHGPIPPGARVKSYPLIERFSALWIWMGDPAKADAGEIPQFDFLVPENWYVGTGHLLIEAPYDLEIDNIMDLSHIEFMHPLFSSEAVRSGKMHSYQDGNTVWSKRLITNDRLPDFLMNAFNIPAGCLADRWLDVRWDAPAQMALYVGGVVSGQPREKGVETPQAHCFTPETQGSTHYFYSMSFPRAMGPQGQALADENVKLLRGPFELEDKPMIEGVAREMAGRPFWDLQPLLLANDGGAVRARRVLEKLIREEAAPQ